jgi:hypothetical protein
LMYVRDGREEAENSSIKKPVITGFNIVFLFITEYQYFRVDSHPQCL